LLAEEGAKNETEKFFLSLRLIKPKLDRSLSWVSRAIKWTSSGDD
jgi:hypothetical protein